MQLPILSSLSELFSKVTEDFKSLFQAWSLVAAGLFLFLNLLLVYPLARGIPAVKAFEGLVTLIQVAVGTFALFFLGYLVNSLSSFFVALAGGQAFRGSLIDGMMRRGQQQHTWCRHPVPTVKTAGWYAKYVETCYRSLGEPGFNGFCLSEAGFQPPLN